MNTTYLDTCCTILSEKKEYPNDELLVYLVRIQKLSQTIAFTVGTNTKCSSLPSMHLPLFMAVQSFQEQLDAFKASLPAYLQDHPSLVCRTAIAQVLLYEVAIADPRLTKPPSPSFLVTNTERLELLWRCANSVREFFDCRFAPPCDITRPRFIALNASDFVYAAQVTLRLVILRAPGWHTNVVLEKLRPSHFVDCVSSEIEQLIERRSQSKWHMEMRSRGLIPKLVDPFEKLHCSLRQYKGMLFKELAKNNAPAAQEERVAEGGGPKTAAQMYAEQRPLVAGPMVMDVDMDMGVDMAGLDDFNLTQIDLMAYDVDMLAWDWGAAGQ